MKRLIAALVCWLSVTAAWAQAEAPDLVVTQAERQRAAMGILLFVLLGIGLTFGLLWVLRVRGILKEEKPDPHLQHLQDEIARRSDELER